MRQYEIRTKDLKAVNRVFEPWSNQEDELRYVTQHFSIYHTQNDVLVLHEWETDAEADRARLNWMNETTKAYAKVPRWDGSGFDYIIGDLPAQSSLHKAIDAARNAPKPKVTVITTPEGTCNCAGNLVPLFDHAGKQLGWQSCPVCVSPKQTKERAVV